MTDWRCNCVRLPGEHYHQQDAYLMVAEIEVLQEALAEIGDYHDDGSTSSIYTQNRVAEVLGDDWWESRFGQ